MVRVKVGITLTEDTLARLEEICKEMGLSKSQALSMLVNKEYLQKYQDDNKVLRHKKIATGNGEIIVYRSIISWLIIQEKILDQRRGI